MSTRPHSSSWAYVVMGVSGCGKTSVGKAIAAHLNLPFVEGDQLHPQANVEKMSQGIPLTDDDRFPWLDKIGNGLATALAGGNGVVVSCSALRKIYRDRLRAFSGERLVFIFLNGSEELLAGRMAARKGHFMPVSLLRSQFATLEDPSTEPHVISIDISGPTSEVVDMAIAAIDRHRQGHQP
ncbi:gluconokinase [Rhizobium sp. KVB221]|uniref:Gluconokinase n=1 Tax=Rhizobium setariae TaxID=2801340 RepID=A0A936YQ16_9HYPH|nr:gluconokinase [Rhizobium setariae]MBL0372124.1 gluconokinase [Rhizobium setariae]